ncbi:hypothetical protein WJX81_005011 [Elliptochloris bilobata]|uniref:Uncharacterized protein n=1 Tax=Elliptochloris bilobata TaxID=381761 RepID=A0AAW1S866_9CHLO
MLSKTKGVSVTQERTEGHNLQGRDSTAQYFYRNSMSDPEYSVSDSRHQRAIPRGLVTPTVHVAEGAPHVSTADFPSPLRHSLADPDAFDVDPKFNRKVT